MNQRDPRGIRFVHQGAIETVVDVPTTTSVLYWLREHAGRVGTKEGCNEGDCGACMVIVGERDPGAPSGVALRAVNACLQPLAALDGRALFTVEDLHDAVSPAEPHPAQRAMVECHGSQCGFCTPGFTMSLAACHDDHARAGTRPTRQELADTLSGNLCRCTGYRPILDAGLSMFDAPVPAIDRGRVAPLLETLAGDPPLFYRAREHAHGGDAWIAAPRDVDALAALYVEHPDARLVAGATDVGLWITKQFRALPKMIRVDAIDALKTVGSTTGGVAIGGGASLEAAWDALVALAPSLREMQLRFASLPLRGAGTMGGNVANGSPIGDGPPVLLALDAVLVLRRGPARRRVALADFYLGYMKNRLEGGEFIEAIEVPRPSAATFVRGYKLSKRYDCDISAVSAGLAIEVVEGRVVEARFAFGGLAATAKRAAGAEAAVKGRAWDEAAVHAATAALAQDFAPIDDLRASAAYRRRVAGNLLMRLYLETRDAMPLARDATTVWPARTVDG